MVGLQTVRFLKISPGGSKLSNSVFRRPKAPMPPPLVIYCFSATTSNTLAADRGIALASSQTSPA